MLSSIAFTILASSALASGSVLARQQPPSAGSAIAAVGAQNVPTPSAASAIAAVGAMNVPTPSAASMIAAVGAMNVPTNGSAVYYTTYTTSILTTYCPSATVVVQGGKSYTVTQATTLTITDCPCTVTAPASASVYVGTALVQSGSPAAPTGSNSGSGAACASACSAAYDTCRSDPNSPRASCASSYASCLGYSPFDNSGSLVTPTACAASGTATASVYVGTAIYRSGTQAATGTPAMYTGAASMEKPVVGLLALGVAAAFL